MQCVTFQQTCGLKVPISVHSLSYHWLRVIYGHLNADFVLLGQTFTYLSRRYCDNRQPFNTILASMLQSRLVRRSSRVKSAFLRRMCIDYRAGYSSWNVYRTSFAHLECFMPCLMTYILTDVFTCFFYLTFYTLCHCALS